MRKIVPFPDRREFLKASVALTAGIRELTLWRSAGATDDAELFIVGPKKGYSPQIGTLVSQMAFMRQQVLRSVQGMSQQDLDFLLDAKANRIGALLLHLVAVEKFYQLNTFDGLAGHKMPEDWKEKWGMPMELGEPARKGIVGNHLDYYLDALSETREKTLAELRKRDDAWLAGGHRARSQPQRTDQISQKPPAWGQTSVGITASKIRSERELAAGQG